MKSKPTILLKLLFAILLLQTTNTWDYIPYSGIEFNPKTGAADQFPLTGTLTNGNYAMCFYSVISATSSNIYYAVYDPKGKEIKSLTKVNHLSGFNCYCNIAADRSNGFAVTWNNRDNQNNAVVNDTWVRYYDANLNTGTPLKLNVQSPRPNVDVMYTQAAFLSNGNFVGMFNPDYLGAGITTIFGQQFTAELNPVTYLANQRISDSLATTTYEGCATSLGTGEMIVTYHSMMYGSWDVVADMYREVDYTQTKATWRVNTTYTSGTQANASSALLINGTVIIVWSDYTYNYLLGVIYNTSGTAVSSNFIINTTSGTVGFVNVKSLGNDGFVTAYRVGNNVFYQLYNLAGTKVGTERKVNIGALAYSNKVWVTSNAEKDFMIVYSTGSLVYYMNYYKDITSCKDFTVYYANSNSPKVQIPFNTTDQNYWVNLTVLPTSGTLQNSAAVTLAKSTLYTETDIWYVFATVKADSFTYTTNYLDTTVTCKVTLAPCFTSCYSCNGAGDATNNLCSACDIAKGYFPLEGKTSNCNLATDTVPGYYFTNNTWKMCYNTCKSCTAFSTDPTTDMKCTSCISNYYPREDKKSSCFTGDISNYYLDLTKNLYIQCYPSCQSCTAVGTDVDHMCKTCLPNYFPKSDAMTSCFTGNVKGYYSDGKVLQKCHSNCASCTTLGTDTNNQCATCIDSLYPKSDNMTNCFSGAFQGYIFDGLKYLKCWSTCKTCTKIPGTKDNNQCTTCSDGYVQMKGSSNCGKIGDSVPGHYYEPIMMLFYPCYKTCSSCIQAGTDVKPNCTSCAKGYYSQDDDATICYSGATGIPGYYVDLTLNKFLPCYKTCLSCTAAGTINSNNCLLCKDGYYQVGGTGMCYKTTDNPEGYYFDTTQLVFKECYKTCKQCSKAGDDTQHNCDTCADGYFNLENNHANCFIQDDPAAKGYYFSSNVYKKCYKTCSSCSGSGDIRQPNCIKCIDDFTDCSGCTDLVYKDTCIKKCPEGTINDTANKTCSECDPDKALYDNACVDSCPDGMIKKDNTCVTCLSIGKFYYKGDCIDSCPENYISNDMHYCNPVPKGDLISKITF
jgi:hypothetical protein